MKGETQQQNQNQEQRQTIVNQNRLQTSMKQIPRVSQIEQLQFDLDEVNYEFKFEKLNINQIPEFPPIYEQEGIKWQLVNDQEVIYQEGKYSAKYKNEEGQESQIDLDHIDYWLIQITCISDYYCYIGTLTEQEIMQDQQIMTIDDVFLELVEDFNDPQLINKENQSIQIKQIDQNMELSQTLQMKKGKNQNLYRQLTWNLQRVKDEQIVEKKIQGLHKLNAQITQKQIEMQKYNEKGFQDIQAEIQKLMTVVVEQQQLQQQITNDLQQQKELIISLTIEQQKQFLQMDDVLKQHQVSAETNQKQIVQNLQTLREQLARVFPDKKENDLNILRPSNLVKTPGLFWVSPKCETGVTSLEFSIKQLNQLGLVLGLDHTSNPNNNRPTYNININHKMLTVGQNKTKFQSQYTPNVEDQIQLKVDMNQRSVVLIANQEEVTSFQLEDQVQAELYVFIGYFEDFEELTDYIE